MSSDTWPPSCPALERQVRSVSCSLTVRNQSRRLAAAADEQTWQQASMPDTSTQHGSACQIKTRGHTCNGDEGAPNAGLHNVQADRWLEWQGLMLY